MNPRLAFLLAVVALLVGCGVVRRHYVPTRYYRVELAAGSAPAAAAKRADAVLAVRALASASRYHELIHFRESACAAGYHDNDRWVEPPAEMVTACLRRALDAAGVARVVADERFVRRPALTLDGRLTRFDEVHGKDQWTAECEVELVLTRGDDSSVLLATRLAASRPAEEKTTPSFVDAKNAAVAELTAKATQAVAKALAGYGAKP
jgi:ABC-type uncharacterized transport system auxiliary subunit